MDALMTRLSDASFGIANAFTGYLIWRCMRPPNGPGQTSEKSEIRDSIGIKPILMIAAICRRLFLAQTFWQGLVCIDRRFAPAARTIYPMNEMLLHWNLLSATCFAIIWIGAYIRLWAYHELAHEFTFELREPDKLKTDGLYRYMQHPSYAGGVPAVVGAAFWFVRCDGAMATILPQWILAEQGLLNWLIPTILLLSSLVVIPIRVSEESAMLKEKFGMEWELWHERTALFIPFLF